MGNNMIPYATVIGENYTYFIYNRYNFIENDKNEEGTFLNTKNGSLDPFDYHVEECGTDSFNKLEHSLIHTCWLGVGEEDEDEEDEDEDDVNLHELECTDGSKEVVLTYNQKCLICLERVTDCIFKQCGHQCICEKSYQNKCDIDILKCVACRKFEKKRQVFISKKLNILNDCYQ